MSDATLSEPHTRITQNRWYLYHSRDTALYGPGGFVRAVIEEVCDETVEGDGGTIHVCRRAFVSAVDLRDTNADQWDKLDEALEAMSDQQFSVLVDQGTIIPFVPPRSC